MKTTATHHAGESQETAGGLLLPLVRGLPLLDAFIDLGALGGGQGSSRVISNPGDFVQRVPFQLRHREAQPVVGLLGLVVQHHGEIDLGADGPLLGGLTKPLLRHLLVRLDLQTAKAVVHPQLKLRVGRAGLRGLTHIFECLLRPWERPCLRDRATKG